MQSNDIAFFLNLMNSAKSELESAHGVLIYCDKATQDLLHELEFEARTYHQKAKIAIEIENIRHDRREAKNKIELLEPIVKYYVDNKKAMDNMTQLLGQTRKTEERQKNRSYLPRVLKKEVESK